MNRRFVLFAVLVLALAAAVAVRFAPGWLPGLLPAPIARASRPSLAGVRGWLGTPLDDDSLAGRPVAMLLWTATDPRSLEALAVLDGWAHAYEPAGVRVFAVHAPDFAFAADSAVPARAAHRLGVTLPIALDPALAIQSAAGGATSGPHLIVSDANGAVLVDSVGLGALASGELAVREMIARRSPGLALPPAAGARARAAPLTVYLDPERTPDGPLHGLESGRARVFTAEFRYQEEAAPFVPVAIGGWIPGPDGLTASRGGAANFVAIRYSAARVGVVLSPPADGPARVWVLVDRQWPDAATRDADLSGDATGAWIEVDEPRLYWVAHGTGPRMLQLSPDQPGVGVHALVFEGAPSR